MHIMKSKNLFAILVSILAFGVLAAPPPPRGRPLPLGPRIHHAPPPRPTPHHHHSHSFWGPGGSHFWPSFISGVAGGIVGNAVVRPTPVVVTQQPTVIVNPTPQPVIIQAAPPKQVWVEGCYETQVINGVLTKVWVPGHYITIP